VSVDASDFEFLGLAIRHDRLVAAFRDTRTSEYHMVPKVGANSGRWIAMSDEEQPLPDPGEREALLRRAREMFAAVESISVLLRFQSGDHLHRSARQQRRYSPGRTR
jgi:hypothetical protein